MAAWRGGTVGQAMKRCVRFSLRRFSLRTLLVAVTALCCILGHGANWVQQRRLFLAEQLEKRKADVNLSGLWGHVKSQNNVGSPGEGVYRDPPLLLGLLGEKGYHHIAIIIPESDTVTRRLRTGSDTLDTLNNH